MKRNSCAGKLILQCILISLLISVLSIPCIAVTTEELFPISVGDTMSYQADTKGEFVIRFNARRISAEIIGDVTYTATVAEITEDKYKGCSIYRLQDTFRNNIPLENQIAQEHYSDDLIAYVPEGIRHIARRDILSSGKPGVWEKYEPPILLYKNNPEPGDEWNAGVRIVDELKIYSKARIEKNETVTTLAGTFQDCVKVVYTSTKITGTIKDLGSLGDLGTPAKLTDGSEVYTEWIAKGIGLVKAKSESRLNASAYVDTIGENARISINRIRIMQLKPGYKVNGVYNKKVAGQLR